jgi:hypothetical protein
MASMTLQQLPVSTVIYENVEDGETVSLEDIWTANPPGQMHSNTCSTKKDLQGS